MIKIVPYSLKFQAEIDSMLNEIATEFEFPITFSDTSKKVKPLENYWVAFEQHKIVGTIGVLKIDDQSIVLKSMFVRKSHRGSTIGLSASLFQKALDWCMVEKIKHIYLGTMSQFYAAHRFYKKNGYQRIAKNELPVNLNLYAIDNVFYKKSM